MNPDGRDCSGTNPEPGLGSSERKAASLREIEVRLRSTVGGGVPEFGDLGRGPLADDDHVTALTEDPVLEPVVREHGPLTIEPADDLYERLARRAESQGFESPEDYAHTVIDTVLDELESDLEEKQAVAEAKRARMEAFQTLSESYADLAADLEPLDDPRAALDRVVDFEEDRDAPAYFEDRLTVLEAVAGSDG